MAVGCSHNQHSTSVNEGCAASSVDRNMAWRSAVTVRNVAKTALGAAIVTTSLWVHLLEELKYLVFRSTCQGANHGASQLMNSWLASQLASKPTHGFVKHRTGRHANHEQVRSQQSRANTQSAGLSYIQDAPKRSRPDTRSGKSKRTQSSNASIHMRSCCTFIGSNVRHIYQFLSYITLITVLTGQSQTPTVYRAARQTR
jgi:hypothetical protein